jgi:hypothetical protein
MPIVLPPAQVEAPFLFHLWPASGYYFARELVDVASVNGEVSLCANRVPTYAKQLPAKQVVTGCERELGRVRWIIPLDY